MDAAQLLETWLSARLSGAGAEWFRKQREALATAYSDRTFHITLGMIPRKLGKGDLGLSEEELSEARACRDNWDPRRWSIADAARLLLLLSTANTSNQSFTERYVELCKSADVAELIALYRGLPIFPDPASFEPQAGEGLRSNMRTVFEAVAHNSPYPKDMFGQDRWNHMVLKALFVDSPLAPIQGLDERANPELARIMCDYAHERWAAGRPVSPELWRCVGPHASGSMYEDLMRVASSEDDNEARAAILSLRDNTAPEADAIRAVRPAMAISASNNEYSWTDIVDTMLSRLAS